MLFGIVFLAISGVVFAQTTETKPPDSGSGGAPSRAIAENPCHSGAADQAEILTDTMGVDFGSYLTRITKIVRQNWYNLMPPSVYPPNLKQGKVSIEFVVQVEEFSGSRPFGSALRNNRHLESVWPASLAKGVQEGNRRVVDTPTDALSSERT